MALSPRSRSVTAMLAGLLVAIGLSVRVEPTELKLVGRIARVAFLIADEGKGGHMNTSEWGAIERSRHDELQISHKYAGI